MSLFPLKVESLYTMADINKEKNIENNGIAKIYFELNPRAIETTAPRLAPLEIPIIPESAMGFFKRLCIVQPHTAKAPPTMTAVIILGNLT